jgi:2-(1,2-epoxy-1,2-dihydrophenyl)acetyl-CoA isomerase
MTKYKKVIFTVEEHVATLIMNRPEKLNALDYEMGEEMKSVVDKVKADDDARVLIITGAGRAFSAGGDVQSHPVIHAKNRQELLQEIRNSQELILKLRSLEKPVIASVNGIAFGVGCELACACDLRIASEKAVFAEIFIQRGMVPDGGGTYFLPRLIGIGKTCELVLTGEPIDAKEAEKIGLVNKVVSHDSLESATKELALKLATASPMMSRGT